jgi:hypothetical protein
MLHVNLYSSVCLLLILLASKTIKDTKGISRSRKSQKYRQCNDQKKKVKRTNNDVQNTTQKTRDCARRNPTKTGGEHIYY